MKYILAALFILCVGVVGAVLPDNYFAYGVYKEAMFTGKVPIITHFDNDSVMFSPAIFDAESMVHGGADYLSHPTSVGYEIIARTDGSNEYLISYYPGGGFYALGPIVTDYLNETWLWYCGIGPKKEV